MKLSLISISKSLLKQNIKSFNDKRRRERKQPKQISWSNQQKKKNLHGEAHFFIHFFAVVLHDHNVKLGQKLPSHKFYGGSFVCVPVPFFSLPLIFTLVAATTSCKNVETLSRKNNLSCFKSLLVTGL